MKRLLSIVLCVLMLLVSTACGESNDTSAPAVNPSGGSSTTAGTSGSWEDSLISTTNPDGSVTVTMSTPAPVIPSVSTGSLSIDGTTTAPSVVVITPTSTSVKPAVPTKPIVKPTESTVTTTKATTTTKKTTTTSKITTTSKKSTTTTVKTTTTKKTTTTTKKTTTTTQKTNPTFNYTTNQVHTAVPITERYMYSILNAQQKQWYLAIDEAVRNLEARVTVTTDNEEWYKVYFKYMFDNPEHFYLCSTCTIVNHGDGRRSIVFSYSDGVHSCHYGSEKAEIDDELRAQIRAKKATFDAEVARIIRTIPANAPAVEKERLIYDRILLDSYYNLGAQWDGLANDNWTAYGIMINKYGVCESYSEAFQTLCLAVGINCTGIVGTAGGGHKWNAVKLDGEWYACDITFDDPIGGDPNDAYHMYFNLTSAEMQAKDHVVDDSDFPVPNCTGTKYSVKNYYGNDFY